MNARATACALLACACALFACAVPERDGGASDPIALQQAPDDPARVRIPLEALGLAEAQRFNTQPTLSFPFFARSDRVLTAAALTLRLADAAEVAEGMSGLDVSVNQEKVVTLNAAALRGPRREIRIPIDAAVIGDKNLLTLRLHTDREGPCGKIPPESWKLIHSGDLEMESAALPLPDELSLLPLPFVDRHFDKEATVALVLPRSPTPAELRAAARVAGWLGVDTGVPLRFVIHLGTLPKGSAVVLIDDARQAQELGLEAPDGPLLKMQDHPKAPRSNLKLLLVAGRTPEELDLAARTLAAGSSGRFQGPIFHAVPLAEKPAPPPDEAPRWLAAHRAVRLEQMSGGLPLRHDGLQGGKIAASFRLPPDIWVWPDEFVNLDLRWEVALPREVPQPRIDVLFNGAYLGRLAELDVQHGEIRGEGRLRIHRSKLKGYNELVAYVNYADADRICSASAGGSGSARVQLLPDSVLHLERSELFSPQPDVESFVNDGFPFTRVADLSQTAVVLSAPLQPRELGLVLSALAHFGSITGLAGAPEFSSAEEVLEKAPDKDLLVTDSGATNLLLRRWADRMPLPFGASAPRPQMPSQDQTLLSLFTGRRGRQELGRASGIVSSLQELSAVEGFESPAHPGRSVLVLAGTGPDALGAFAQFRGFAEGVVPRGDLLVASAGQRYRFSIGPGFGRGPLSRWSRLRWFLAQYPLLLVPFLLCGVLALAAVLRQSLEARVRRRLDLETT